MDPIFGSILGGVFDLFGTSNQNAQNEHLMRVQQDFNKQNARTQNRWTQEYFNQSKEFNAAEAEKARAFEERMSNSAYQRQISDMQKAGLNPLMAAMKGGGASTPSGSAASSGSPQGAATASPSLPRMEALKMGEAINRGISNSMELKRLNKDVEVADTVKELNTEGSKLKRTEALLTANSAEKVRSENEKIKAEKEIADWNKISAKYGAESSLQRARQDINNADISDAMLDIFLNKADFIKENDDAYYWSDLLGNIFGATAKGAASLR